MNTVKTYTTLPETALDEIIRRHRDQPGGLLSTLEEAQEHNPARFLPPETLIYISQQLRIPFTRVYSVVTFYSFFNLKPQGKHAVVVCRGTACHTKGSRALLEDAGRAFGFNFSEEDSESAYTTPDNMFTVRTVACFGQCAQSPVISLDGVIYSNVNSQKLINILSAAKAGKTLKD